jgi:hypothetical protein
VLPRLLHSFILAAIIISGVFFKFHLIVGVEESIVNALYGVRITDQLFKSDVLQEWCVHINSSSSTPTTR